MGRFDRFALPPGDDRNLRTPDGRSDIKLPSRIATVGPWSKPAQGGFRAFRQGPLNCRLSPFGVAICNGRNTSICAVRVLEMDVAHRVHMLHRKFVRRVLVAVGAAQEALRHPSMQRVSARTGLARDDPVGAVRYALERPSTPPDQVRGSGRGEKGPAWGSQTLQKRRRPGYIRISFETERPPSFCGDRARGGV